MKKILLVLSTFAVFCGNAFAADFDWTNMTDDEINAIIAAGQAELANRNPVSSDGVLHMTEETVLLDQNGILVTLSGKIETMDYYHCAGLADLLFGCIGRHFRATKDTREPLKPCVYFRFWCVISRASSRA